MARRVVVTGAGAVCPLGDSARVSWSRLIEGASGVAKLEGAGYDALPCRIAALVPQRERFDASKGRSKATMFALAAAEEALNDAGWQPKSEILREKTGVAIGTGMVDLSDVSDADARLRSGLHKLSPFFVPRILPNMAAGHVSIRYGFRGPNHAVSTACATGAHSIGDGFRFIKAGDADVMVCGGAESCVSPLAVAGFCRLRALTTNNDEPTKASRPFDLARDGFVMGEGASVLILEELEHAKSRGAKIYAEVLGYGLSGDASHMTAPREDGSGATLSMSRALKEAGSKPEDVGYVNAHATSTPLGDAIESRAIAALLGRDVLVCSTKGAHGHLLGAAGNLESLFTVMSCYEKTIPPILNLERISDVSPLNYVLDKKREWTSSKRRVALKNSFGFGGTNASLCIAEF